MSPVSRHQHVLWPAWLIEASSRRRGSKFGCLAGRLPGLQCQCPRGCPSPPSVPNPLQTFDTHTTDFYNSAEFQQMASQSAAFLDLLPPYLDGRSVSLENMVRTLLAV